jgi:hypothetical protein
VRALPAVIVCALVAAPAVARAETTAIVVAGDPGKKPIVVDAVAPWLEAKGQSVLLDSVPRDEVDKLVDCFLLDDARCAVPIVAESGVGRFVFVMVEAGANEDVTLTGWLFAGAGKAVAQDRKVCPACRVDAVTKAAQDLIAALWRAGDPSGSTLRITSNPSGARIAVDGAPSGWSPIELEVTPGDHTVTATKDGHDPISTKVSAQGGKIHPVELVLERTARVRPSKSRLPLIVIGAGGALVIGAGILLALDEDNPAPGPNRPATYTDTSVPALVLGGVGLATAGAGVYLMLRKPGPAEQPAAASAVAPGTVIVGWTGRF